MIGGKVIQDTAVEEVVASISASESAAIAAVAEKVPDCDLPTSAGTYVLKVTVDGDTKTYSWVAESV